MQIKIVKTERISEQMERWQVCLTKDKFMEFGFYLEALEGVGLHRRSYEADNLMEVDVATGFRDEALALIADLAKER
jgi:hypothetical protein